MIKGVLIFNNQGLIRLSKFYEPIPIHEQQEVINEIYALLCKRKNNFLYINRISVWGKGLKIVYRFYVTLYFVFCVDGTESELGTLDMIHAFVESLNTYFNNVCELHIIFNMEKVHHILDELILGGMVLETNIKEAYTHIKAMEKLENDGAK